MSAEAGAIIVTLAGIGFVLWEIRGCLRLIVYELSTARWERGVRGSARYPDPK